MKISTLANKYALAFLSASSEKDLEASYGQFDILTKALKMQSIQRLIYAPRTVAKYSKVDCLLKLLNDPSKLMERFLKVLDDKNRLYLILEIANALHKKRSLQQGSFEGVVLSREPLEESHVSQLEKSLSKKLNKNITLSSQYSNFDGIGVEIDALGLEVSFSKEVFKNQLMGHILKVV